MLYYISHLPAKTHANELYPRNKMCRLEDLILKIFNTFKTSVLKYLDDHNMAKYNILYNLFINFIRDKIKDNIVTRESSRIVRVTEII